MIDPKELRIDNIINCYTHELEDEDDDYSHVVTAEDIHLMVKMGTASRFAGMPLTEDLLIKLGYKYSSTLFDSKIYRKG